MPVTATPIFPQTLNTGSTIIQPADTTALKTVYTGGANGSRITEIAVTSDETANARVLALYTNDSGTDRLIGSFNVPVNSGFTSSAPTVFPLKSTQFGYASTGISTGLNLDTNGNPFIQLKASEILKIKSLTTLATGKTITIRASGVDF